MSVDLTRLPVVIGVAQFTNRDSDPLEAPDPFAMMEDVARKAAEPAARHRASVDSVLRELSHVLMVHSLSLRHGDPAAELARRLGADKALARCSGMGGNIPQWLVNRVSEMVVAGARPLALITGAEALATRKRAKVAGLRLEWPSSPGWPETWPPLEPDLGVHPAERSHGLEQATTMYALVETAIAHAEVRDPVGHMREVGSLMARFNEVAASNPMSWFGGIRGADEIITVNPDNRMICHPYPKFVNAVMDVDMAGALLMTDAQSARELGFRPDQVVYLTGWADAHDIWYLSQRPVLQRSPALTACAEAALSMAATDLDGIDAFDLYACFPSSVEVARDSFGIDPKDPRPITLTGGLPYHGGPGSNYVTHAIANSFDWLLSGNAERTMVHGNGYYLTKHSIGLYSASAPGETPVPHHEIQHSVDASASPLDFATFDDEGEGSALGGQIVAYTVPFGRDGAPGTGILLADVDGRRAIACAGESLTRELLSHDAVGDDVVISRGNPGDRGERGERNLAT